MNISFVIDVQGVNPDQYYPCDSYVSHITPVSARAIASQWHTSMFDPLYAFSSSGIVRDHLALLASLRGNLRDLNARNESRTRDARDLNALYRFARDCLALQPDGSMLAPWARGAS